MSQELLTPPELETNKLGSSGLHAGVDEPNLLIETDGSMWASLVENVRYALAPKPAPLQLTSQPAEDTLSVREEPVWKSLVEGVQDVFFPRKLPPLQLTSKAVAVVDPFAGKRSFGPGIAAIVLVCGSILVVLLWASLHVRPIKVKQTATQVVDLKPYTPIAPKMKDLMGGGGGGGDRDLVQVSKGKLPKFDTKQITPPQIIRNEHPKLAVEPTIVMPKNITLPNNNMPDIGMPTSTQTAVLSNGTGSGAGMGSGKNGGLGSGSGGGYGPGSGGGTGGGVYHVGGGVSGPQVIYSVDPEFSDEARRAKYQGTVALSLTVDAQGNPQNVRVIHPLGMGLDEKAVEAIRQYKFKPAFYQGHPVAVADVTITVDFHIY